MFGRLADLIAPDYCYGCDLIGTVLCQSCHYDIVSEPFVRCVSCVKPLGVNGRCRTCRLPYSYAWIVGWRQGVLEAIVGASKFDSNRRACRKQAELLDSTLPQLPLSTVVVPVPTTRPHIRQRGYGHAELIARNVAKLRRVEYKATLKRRKHSVQHGSSKSDRHHQAKTAYYVSERLDPDTIYILIDDVYTTGATAKWAAKTLRKAGAKHIWLAITTRQPLDE